MRWLEAAAVYLFVAVLLVRMCVSPLRAGYTPGRRTKASLVLYFPMLLVWCFFVGPAVSLTMTGVLKW